MTVSKALREAKDISAGTRARIQQVARELGYMPDVAARALRTRSTRCSGWWFPRSPIHPIYARILVALEEQAYHLGYDVIFSHSLNRPEREEECLRRLLSRRVDGLFISPVYRLDQASAIYDMLLTQGTPTVILGHRALLQPVRERGNRRCCLELRAHQPSPPAGPPPHRVCHRPLECAVVAGAPRRLPESPAGGSNSLR